MSFRHARVLQMTTTKRPNRFLRGHGSTLRGPLPLCVLIGLLLLVGGCGGSDDPAKRTASTPSKTTPVPAPAIDESPDMQTPDDGAAQGAQTPGAASSRKSFSTGGPAAGGEGAQVSVQPRSLEGEEGAYGPHPPGGRDPNKPARPEDFLEWKPEDYLAAKAERDRLLADAVRFAGQNPQWQTKPQVVKLFIQLLETQEPPEQPKAEETNADEPYGRRNEGRFGGYNNRDVPAGQVEPQVAREIIAALGNHESQLALDTLEALLTGKQEVPLEMSEIVPEVVKALVAKENPRREELLFRIVTNPDMVKIPEPVEETEPESPATTRNPSGSRQDFGPRGFEDEGGAGYSPGGYGSRGFGRGGYGRGGAGQPIDATWIQEQVLQQAGDGFVMSLRTRLARHLENPKVTIETAQLLEPFLARDDPRNLPAQALLYVNPKTMAETRQQVEQQLVRGSALALNLAMGVPVEFEARPGGMRGGYGGYGGGRLGGFQGGRLGGFGEEDGFGYAAGGPGPTSRGLRGGPPPSYAGGPDNDGSGRPSATGRPSRNPTPETNEPSAEDNVPAREEPEKPDFEPYYVELARTLWTPKMAAAIGAAAQAAPADDSWRSSPYQLAATVPLSESRQALAEYLAKEEDDEEGDGAGNFNNNQRDLGALLNGAQADPALLVLSKSIYLKRRPRSSTSGRTRNGRPEDDFERQQQEWVSRIEPFVTQLCARCDAAARAQSPTKKPDAASLEAVPVRLHKDAHVVAQHSVRLPRGIDPRFSGVPVAPLEMHYVRIEEEGDPQRLYKIYRNQAGHSQERNISGGKWIDGYNSSDQQSIDIRVTLPSGAGGRGGAMSALEGEEGYGAGRRRPGTSTSKPEPVMVTIEILTVKIAPPSESE